MQRPYAYSGIQLPPLPCMHSKISLPLVLLVIAVTSSIVHANWCMQQDQCVLPTACYAMGSNQEVKDIEISLLG